ncbi:MAG TPA: carbohydrate kinase family protein [bacterium]|nr:carbohydrate kinase family protein [bacterium]
MILVIGTTTLDLYVSGIEQMPEFRGDEFTVDSLVYCDRPLRMMPGGNGANTAFVLGSLGAPVSLCSGIGQDTPGDLLVRWLESVDVDLENLIRSDQAQTSSTTMIADAQRNRLAFHHHGASGCFGPDDLSENTLKKTDIVLITGYPLLTKWRPDGVRALLRKARASGITTALDIGPAVGEPAGLSELESAAADLDILLCNEHELAELVDSEDIEESIHKVSEAGVGTVVVKQGRQGAVAGQRDRQGLLKIAGFPGDTDLTVGAGDAFNAGVLLGTHQGRDLGESLQFANALAALVVASGRGVLGCPLLREIRQVMNAKSGG